MSISNTLAALRERIRQRVNGAAPAAPDLRLPRLEHFDEAAKAAENWAAVAGQVNPRPAGALNMAAQSVKRLISRSLRWYSYPQRQFNRSVVDSLAELRAVLEEQNRNIVVLAQLSADAQRTSEEVAQLRSEVVEQGRSLDGRIMSNVARLDAEIGRRFDELAGHMRGNVDWLNNSINEVQERFWREFAVYKTNLGEKVDEELRLIRQRLRAAPQPTAAGVAPPGAAATSQNEFDYPLFEHLFRGRESDVRARQLVYVPYFRERAPVLDIACGRGEFLALLRENGIEARGVDLDADMVARCQDRGLDATRDDAFAYLDRLEDNSLGGIFSAQFIEHLTTPQYRRLIELAHRKLRSGGALVLETQNPECLAIFSQSFFVDPTHVRPIPPAQLRFWMEEAGLRDVQVHYVSPVAPSLPVLPLLETEEGKSPAGMGLKIEEWNREARRFNAMYFGFQDYAAIGIKP